MREEMQFVCTLTFTRGRYSGQRVHVFDEVNLGRDERCGLRLMDAGVSRMHALLSPRRESPSKAFSIVDLGSTNGTRVNGEVLVGARQLEEHDEIGIGEASATVSFGHAPTRSNGDRPILLEASVETLRESQWDAQSPAMRFDVSSDLVELLGALSDLGATGRLERANAAPLWLERGVLLAPTLDEDSPSEKRLDLGASVLCFEPCELPKRSTSWHRVSLEDVRRARRGSLGVDAPPKVYFPLAGAGDIEDVEKPAPWSIWRVEMLPNHSSTTHQTLTTVDQHTFGEALVRMAWHRWRANKALWPLRRSAAMTFAYEHIEPHLCSLDTFRGASAQLALFLRAWLHDLDARRATSGWPMTHIFATGRFDEQGALRGVRGVDRKVARVALFARQHPEARCVMFAPMLDLDEVPDGVIVRELDEVPDFIEPRATNNLLVIGLYPEQVGALLDALDALVTESGHDEGSRPR